METVYVDNPMISALLSKVTNLLKGVKDLTPLKIELNDFTCKWNKGVTSEIYHGKVLKFNGNVIDVECNTGRIHVAQPDHWHDDKPFTSETLIEVDNLGVHLQCDTDAFKKYLKFLITAKTKGVRETVQGVLHKIGLGSKNEEEDAVWNGQALCDIKTLEIANPKIFVETLQPGNFKRDKSNVEQFREALKTFAPQEVEDEASLEVENEVPKAEEAKPEGNPLITFDSIQKGSCIENPYSKTGSYADTQHKGLCGFLLLRTELNVDGIKVVWTQETTKLLAKLLSLSKKFTISKFLYYILKNAGFVAEKGADAVDSIRRKLSFFSRMFAPN